MDRFAREFLNHLQQGDVSAAATQVDARSKGSELEAGLGEIVRVLHGRQPDSVRIVGFEAFIGKETTRRNLTYELAYPDGWVVATVGVLERDSARTITGARANDIPRQAAADNAFRLVGKSVGQYAFLAVMLAIPVFVLWTLALVIRSDLRRKWLWALFILLPVGKLSQNWTTGQMWLQWAQVQLLGAGFLRNGGPYLPWVLSVGLPLGAILAQLKLRAHRTRPPAAPEAPTPPGLAASAT